MMGSITRKVLEQDSKVNSTIVGFIDDMAFKVGKKLADSLEVYLNAEDDDIDGVDDEVKVINDKDLSIDGMDEADDESDDDDQDDNEIADDDDDDEEAATEDYDDDEEE